MWEVLALGTVVAVCFVIACASILAIAHRLGYITMTKDVPVEESIVGQDEERKGINDAETIIDEILETEGGWNPKDDRGRGSYAGITNGAWIDFRKSIKDAKNPYPEIHSVQNLQGRPEVVRTFYRWYLGRSGVWDLPKWLHYVHADAYVMHGSWAINFLENALYLDETHGVWNEETKSDIQSVVRHIDGNMRNSVIERYSDRRRAFIRRLHRRDEQALLERVTNVQRTAIAQLEVDE